MLLVTGSSGLVGSALGTALTSRGIEWRGFDIRESEEKDIRDEAALSAALAGVDGVIHLAAVSRVVWAERNPARAQSTNVDALGSLIRMVRESPKKPWLLFASSREVYGEQRDLPVREDARLQPVNTYARTKVAGERLVEQAAIDGLRTQIVRFSNVYGSVADHCDRVVPAFARTAANGGTLRIEGAENMFDFTHVSDVEEGLGRVIDAMIAGERFPPIHFASGQGTTLGDLAAIAADVAAVPVSAEDAPPRTFDVSRFVGDPSRARELLGWSARIAIREGFRQLADEFAAQPFRDFETGASKEILAG